MKTVLDVHKITKSFKKHEVLKQVSFNLHESEIVGFVGENGAGKSTTMKCICNLIFPDSGDIVISGYNLKTHTKEAMKCISALIESPGLYPSLSGMENIILYGKLHHCSQEQIQKTAEATGLNEQLKRNVQTYSMGMKQTLAIYIALMSKPKLLILDEPTNGLDQNGMLRLRSLLKRLTKEEKIAVLISSHQLGELDKVVDRVIFIHKGEIVQTTDAIENHRSYEVEMDHPEKLEPFLKQQDYIQSFTIQEHTIRITLSNQEAFQAFLTLCIKQDIQVLDIRKIASDIELIYDTIYGDNYVESH